MTTRRLELTPWTEDDWPELMALIAQRDARTPGASRYRRPGGDDVRSFITGSRDCFQRVGIGVYAVRTRDGIGGGTIIGRCGLQIGRADHVEPEITYELDRQVRGHGYATEAGRAVVAAAAATGRRHLRARVRPWNTASIQVLTRLAFTPTSLIHTDQFGELHHYICDLCPDERP